MNNWLSFIYVAIGGAIGSVSRYKLSTMISQQMTTWSFPIYTFTINILGCLCIGIFAAISEKQTWFTTDLRLLLITGLLGGFTTFSAFGLETFVLIRRGELISAITYVGLSVLIGLICVWLGYILIDFFSSFFQINN